MSRRRTQAPVVEAYDESHLVGYVEEGETVEMIMKKFETLEKLQKDLSSQGKSELDEDALKEVFKQTSIFSVESALQDEEPAPEEYQVIDYEEDEFGNFFFFGE
jgi:hypothetical protein